MGSEVPFFGGYFLVVTRDNLARHVIPNSPRRVGVLVHAAVRARAVARAVACAVAVAVSAVAAERAHDRRRGLAIRDARAAELHDDAVLAPHAVRHDLEVRQA